MIFSRPHATHKAKTWNYIVLLQSTPANPDSGQSGIPWHPDKFVCPFSNYALRRLRQLQVNAFYSGWSGVRPIRNYRTVSGQICMSLQAKTIDFTPANPNDDNNEKKGKVDSYSLNFCNRNCNIFIVVKSPENFKVQATCIPFFPMFTRLLLMLAYYRSK